MTRRRSGFRLRSRFGLRSRFRVRDVLDESVAALAERPGRAILTTAGTVLGVGTFVAVLGLTATASQQIGDRFDALRATEVTVKDGRADVGVPDDTVPLFPPDADARAAALHGVVAAGVTWTPRDAQVAVHGAPIGGDAGIALPVLAASPGYLDAAEVTLAEGRTYDAFHDSTDQLVAVLGRVAAGQLGIATLEGQPAVFVGQVPFTVVGILDDSSRAPNLLLSVVVPRGTAIRLWGQPTIDDAASMLVTTRTGAAQQVAAELPYAVRPDAPGLLAAVPPPDPRSLRQGVDTDLTTLFLALAGICLLVGAVGIANTTLVAVMERVPEIGLRRSLGATRGHVVVQVLTESGMLGALGGIVGASLGVVGVVAVAAPRTWTPVIEPLTVLAAPLMGLVAGLAAGTYPALRAGRIEPVEALRR